MSWKKTARATRGWQLAVALVATAVACLAPATAGAATTVYPAGGSTFTGGAEGWTPAGASCNLALLCESSAVYDGAVGNPPGSISARTTMTVNLLDLIEGTATWHSPEFTIPAGTITGATLSLDRAFSSGDLIDLEPKAEYTVTLRDLSTNTAVPVLTEALSKDATSFLTKSATASVVGTHKYRLELTATTGQGTVSLSLITGTTDARFDNVRLAVVTADSGGGGGSNPGGGGGKDGGGKKGGKNRSSTVTNRQLKSIVSRSMRGPAGRLRGNRLRVKVRCPKRIGRACTIVSQGYLRRGRKATGKTRSKVGSGKSKNIVLRVKPKMRRKLAKRKRILMRYKVRAGKARTSFYRARRLVVR